MDPFLSCQSSLKLCRFLPLPTVFIVITLVCPAFGKPMVKPLPIGFIVQRRNNTASDRTTGIPGSEMNKGLQEKMSKSPSATIPTSNVLPNWKITGATQIHVTHKQNWTETWSTKTNPVSAVSPIVGTSSSQFPMPNSTISLSKKDNRNTKDMNESSKERKIIPDNVSPLHSLSTSFFTSRPPMGSKRQDVKTHPHFLAADSNLPYTTPPKMLPTKSAKNLYMRGGKNTTISISEKTRKPKFIETTIANLSFDKSDSLKLTATPSKPVNTSPKISSTPLKAVGIPTKVITPENPQWLPSSTVKSPLSTTCAKCTIAGSKTLLPHTGLQEHTSQIASTVEAKSKDRIKGKTLKPIKILPSSTLSTISMSRQTVHPSTSFDNKSIEKHLKVTKTPNMKSATSSFATPNVTPHPWSLPIPTESSDSLSVTKTTYPPPSSTLSLLPSSSPSSSLSSSFTKSTTNHSAIPEQTTTITPETRHTPTVVASSTSFISTSISPTTIKLKTPNPTLSTNITTNALNTTTYPTTPFTTPKTTTFVVTMTKVTTTTTTAQPTTKPTTTTTTMSTTTTTTTTTHIPTHKTSSRIWSSMIVPITTRQTPAILPLHITVHLKMTWFDFCQLKSDFLRDLARFLKEGLQTDIGRDQITLLSPEVAECGSDRLNRDQRNEIDIKLYLTNIEGVYNPELTQNGFSFIAQGLKTDVRSPFHNWLDKVYLVPGQSRVGNVSPSTDSQKMDTGVAIAIALATIGGLCCLALLVLQIIVHRRRCQKLHMYMPSRKLSLASLNSIALANMSRSRPCSGLYNAGMDPSDHAELSHPLDYQGLKNMCSDIERIYDEFQLLPNVTPKHSDLPMGVEEKNRFIDVLPTPETRVKLKTIPGEENSDYINANFISGPNEEKKAYIATQAPLECTVADFWRMVWEQQGRVIVMLTDMDERGMPKGTPYCPDAEDISSIGLYGDHEVILKTKDFKQEYIASTLELKDMENNLVRKLKHFWYTSWPAHGFPEPISLVKFILDVRLQNEEKLAPLIVHCSSGTGRTGTFVAIDSGIKMFDKSHTVDILNCVYRMRLERPRAVQTKQQYALIYKALLEYASMVVSPSTSSTSSRATGNAVTYTW